MVEIGDSLEIEIVRHWGRGEARQNSRHVASVKIYHDGSVVTWAAEPAFELRKTRIDLKDSEAAWATVVRAITTALKAGY